MNGMCCLGDSDDPGIRMCIGEEGGMNDSGSRRDTSCHELAFFTFFSPNFS